MMLTPISPTIVTLDQLLAWRQKARHLSLKTLRIKAMQGGVYLSRFKGRGMEFEEVRRYQAGDDVRAIDWRVTARTQKVHTKLFREEKERPVLFCLDLSSSLFFASQQAYKAVMGAHILALLSWAAHHHHDRVGGIVFDHNQLLESDPKRREKGVLSLLRQVINHQAWQTKSDELLSEKCREDAFLKASRALRKIARPGSLIFMISDWSLASDAMMAEVQQIASHSDMIIIFLYDKLESMLPSPGQYPILISDTFHLINTADPLVREAYEEAFENRVSKLYKICRRLGIQFVPCATHDNIFELLNNHFNKPET
ncbi:MAG: DUF58 domain-containing protein [Gammaproteobacteria bacterium]